VHPVCGWSWFEHGLIGSGSDGQVVCPGNWIIPRFVVTVIDPRP
jgi:hypothetical protein